MLCRSLFALDCAGDRIDALLQDCRVYGVN